MVEKGSDSDILDDPGVADATVPSLTRDAWLRSPMLQNAILASAHVSVMATDLNGCIRLFNVGAECMLGYPALEVVGKLGLVDIHDPDALLERARALSRELSTPIAADFAALACKAARMGDERYESTLMRKDRKGLPVAISITALRDQSGGTVGYLVIVTHTSAHQQKELARYDVGSRAAHADSSPSELLARMSHELRTPLSAILGFAQLLGSGAPSPSSSQKRSIDLILQAGWHLEELITMTCDLALLESGAMSLSLDAVPLTSVMQDCQATLESQAPMRGGVPVTFPRLEAPYFVLADRFRLQQVLGILLCAAIEFSGVGAAVVLDCDTRRSESIRVEVNDGGAGSSPRRQTQRFQPFDGLDHGAKATPGAGIGLLLAKRLVEVMGGTIVGESIVGTGKVFSFDLKRMPVPIGASPTFAHSCLGKAEGPTAARSQSTIPPAENHANPPR